jgi:hypothetical protein
MQWDVCCDLWSSITWSIRARLVACSIRFAAAHIYFLKVAICNNNQVNSMENKKPIGIYVTQRLTMKTIFNTLCTPQCIQVFSGNIRWLANSTASLSDSLDYFPLLAGTSNHFSISCTDFMPIIWLAFLELRLTMLAPEGQIFFLINVYIPCAIPLIIDTCSASC